MNNIERKEFWDVLCSAQDESSESIKEIQGAIKSQTSYADLGL